jgi:hypothetical protein
MNIQPVKSENVQAPLRPKTPPAKAPQLEPEASPAHSVRTARLRDLIAAEPAVRPAEVERGKALAKDPQYPSDNVLAKLAEMFAEGTGK